MTDIIESPVLRPTPEGLVEPRRGLIGWLTTTDHKRVALMTIGASIFFFLVFGLIALAMRSQLGQPEQHVVSNQLYNELFTMHGSGMIFMVITPLAVGLCLYLVPLQVGAPMVAAPRLCLFSLWTYVFAALLLCATPLTGEGADTGWYSYLPLSDSQFAPGAGEDLFFLAGAMAVGAMLFMSGAVLWTALKMRAPGMSLMRMPIFTWSAVATCLMSVAAFPALLAAFSLQAAGRIDPSIFSHNTWDMIYQQVFWFYGHPVVYVMFFPFVGCVAEVLATFSGRKYFGYHFTVFALLAFAVGSMAVWGHHMFTTGQEDNAYFSLTSIMLSVPAGVEYFGFLGTILGGRLVYRTPMLFALAFIPQFLVGGLTGIMIATPVLDYQFHGSYFIVAHFHYTLFAGSVFGAFAGLYFWFPKATGFRLGEGLGRVNFALMCIGTNLTFLPMFFTGYDGLPRRVATYEPQFGTANLISSIGAGVIALGVAVFIFNVLRSSIVRVPAGDDPWGLGQTLEWSTSSPPPMFNYDAWHPIRPITSFTPLLDRRAELQPLTTDRLEGERPSDPRLKETVP